AHCVATAHRTRAARTRDTIGSTSAIRRARARGRAWSRMDVAPAAARQGRIVGRRIRIGDGRPRPVYWESRRHDTRGLEVDGHCVRLRTARYGLQLDRELP